MLLRLDPGCCSFQIPKSASDKTCTFLEDASEGTLPHLKTADRIERSSTSRLFNPFEVCLLRERFSLKRCNFQAGKQRTLRWRLHEHVRAKMVLLTNILFKFSRLKETVRWTREASFQSTRRLWPCLQSFRSFMPKRSSGKASSKSSLAEQTSSGGRWSDKEWEGTCQYNEHHKQTYRHWISRKQLTQLAKAVYIERKEFDGYVCVRGQAKSCAIAECFCKCMRAFLSPRGSALYHRTTSRLLHQKYVYTKYLWHETAFAPNNL